MSKRGKSKFEKVDGEYYPTVDMKAFRALMSLIEPGTRFYEPCAGEGHIVRGLALTGVACVGASDIEPKSEFFDKRDALSLKREDLGKADCIITNPPHSAPLLFYLIHHLRMLLPTWVLVPIDKLATAQSVDQMQFCSLMTVVGRLNWMEGTKTTGMDNFVWALFQADPCETRFVNSAAAWSSLSRGKQ